MGKEEKKTEVISEFGGKGFKGGKGKCECWGGRDWGKKAQNDEEEIKLSRNIKIFLKISNRYLKASKRIQLEF